MNDLFNQPVPDPTPDKPPDLSYVPEAIRKKFPAAWMYCPLVTVEPSRDPDDTVITMETWYRVWKFYPFQNHKLVIYYKKMQNFNL